MLKFRLFLTITNHKNLSIARNVAIDNRLIILALAKLTDKLPTEKMIVVRICTDLNDICTDLNDICTDLNDISLTVIPRNVSPILQ